MKEAQRIVAAIRRKWSEVPILIRGDAGFCRERIMAWCEQQPGVDYVLGMAKNSRLTAAIEEAQTQAKDRWEQTGEATRVFRDFT